MNMIKSLLPRLELFTYHTRSLQTNIVSIILLSKVAPVPLFLLLGPE